MRAATRTRATMASATGAVTLSLLVGLVASPARGGEADGFLYGRITTRSGNAYEGRLEWGGEEALWGEHFNGTKRERPYIDEAPDRRRREPIRIFGITIGVRTESSNGGRHFVARFGDIDRIEIGRSRGAELVMKNGSRYEIRGGSNDIGAEITVWDSALGKIDVDWRQIDTVDFRPAPPELEVGVRRLYGTVSTDAGEYRGLIQWDQDENLSTDKLDGETRDGDLEIEMGRIRVIERRSFRSSRVELKDGRELILEGTNDVNDDNRGVFVDDLRYGRVLVSWRAFERVELSDPPDSGPAYDDFETPGPLRGTVTRRGGARYSGRLVYDLDESEGWELLEGSWRDIEYNIPFAMIASITPEGRSASRIVLKNGEELTLEDSVDVSDDNAGVLVFEERSRDPVYIAWDEIERVELE